MSACCCSGPGADGKCPCMRHLGKQATWAPDMTDFGEMPSEKTEEQMRQVFPNWKPPAPDAAARGPTLPYMTFDIDAVKLAASKRIYPADAGMREIEPMETPTLISQRFANNVEGLVDVVRQHLLSTFDPSYHYMKSGVQIMDIWDARGSLSSTSLDNASKYLNRYGRKEGKNPKDLVKAIACILMAYQKDIVEDDPKRKDS